MSFFACEFDNALLALREILRRVFNELCRGLFGCALLGSFFVALLPWLLLRLFLRNEFEHFCFLFFGCFILRSAILPLFYFYTLEIVFDYFIVRHALFCPMEGAATAESYSVTALFLACTSWIVDALEIRRIGPTPDLLGAFGFVRRWS